MTQALALKHKLYSENYALLATILKAWIEDRRPTSTDLLAFSRLSPGIDTDCIHPTDLRVDRSDPSEVDAFKRLLENLRWHITNN